MRIERHAAVPDVDRASLLDLWVRAWEPVVPDIDFRARLPWFTTYLDGLLGDGALLLIGRQGNGTAAGFLTVHPQSGVLDQLAVAPEAAGHGLGTALLAEAKRLSPGSLRLTVNTVNGRAIALYGKAGFVADRQGSNPLSGLPTLAMRWTAASKSPSSKL